MTRKYILRSKEDQLKAVLQEIERLGVMAAEREVKISRLRNQAERLIGAISKSEVKP